MVVVGGFWLLLVGCWCCVVVVDGMRLLLVVVVVVHVSFHNHIFQYSGTSQLTVRKMKHHIEDEAR